MAGQGCPGEGPDERFLGWLVCPIQNLFSFKSAKPPRWLIKFTGRFQYWFPEKRDYVWLGVAWPPYFIWQGVAEHGRIIPVPVAPEYPDGLKWQIGMVSMVRFGWRYDVNWDGGGFIFPTIAVKVRSLPFPLEKGY
jgi:hypothetical protein